MRYFLDLEKFEKNNSQSDDNIHKHIKKFLYLSPNERELIIRASRDEIFAEDFMEKLSNVLKTLEDKNVDFNQVKFALECDYSAIIYTDLQWQTLTNIANIINEKGLEFCFLDWGSIFNINQVGNANAQIETIATKIQEMELSPYEKLMATYMVVTSKKYKNEGYKKEGAVSRSIYGVLNGDDIVCVGFSKWLKSIVEKFGDDNIKIYENVISTKDKYHLFPIKTYHENLICYIKDEKYGIDGYYKLDPTFDSQEEENIIKSFTYFLVPLFQSFNDASYNYSACLEGEANKMDLSDGRSYNQRIDISPTVSFGTDRKYFSREFLTDLFGQEPKLANDFVYEETEKYFDYFEYIVQSLSKKIYRGKDKQGEIRMRELANSYLKKIHRLFDFDMEYALDLFTDQEKYYKFKTIVWYSFIADYFECSENGYGLFDQLDRVKINGFDSLFDDAKYEKLKLVCLFIKRIHTLELKHCIKNDDDFCLKLDSKNNFAIERYLSEHSTIIPGKYFKMALKNVLKAENKLTNEEISEVVDSTFAMNQELMDCSYYKGTKSTFMEDEFIR